MGYKGANVPRIDARSPGAGWLGRATAHGKRNGLLPRLFQSGGWAAPVIYRPRKFGRIELWPRSQEAQALQGLGPEPLSEEFTAQRLAQALARRKSAIKPALLSQEIVAGLGNIYADEALYDARIHPLRPASSLTAEEI